MQRAKERQPKHDATAQQHTPKYTHIMTTMTEINATLLALFVPAQAKAAAEPKETSINTRMWGVANSARKWAREGIYHQPAALNTLRTIFKKHKADLDKDLLNRADKVTDTRLMDFSDPKWELIHAECLPLKAAFDAYAASDPVIQAHVAKQAAKKAEKKAAAK